VGAGIAIFENGKTIVSLKYRLNDKCSNNQAEQIAILKALEKLQNLDPKEKIVQLFTDSRITIEAIKHPKNHTRIIDLIRTKVFELEEQHWSIKIHWIKAHAEHHGNEVADQLAKEAAAGKQTGIYNKIPKSTIMKELREDSLEKWQSEWNNTTIGQITKQFFPVIQDRLSMKIKITPIFTMLITGHGNLKSYLHKLKIIDTPICPCRKEEQTVDHLLYVCELLQKERGKLILGVAKTNNWPISKRRLLSEHSQVFHKFSHEISLEQLNEVE
jgi:ribonuclease HI